MFIKVVQEIVSISTGDIIVRIDNKDVDSMDDYKNIISNISGNVLVKAGRGYSVIKEPKID